MRDVIACQGGFHCVLLYDEPVENAEKCNRHGHMEKSSSPHVRAHLVVLTVVKIAFHGLNALREVDPLAAHCRATDASGILRQSRRFRDAQGCFRHVWDHTGAHINGLNISAKADDRNKSEALLYSYT